MDKLEEIPYKQEILRKLIHISSLAIPIIYSFVSREIGLIILIPMTLISIILDVLLHRSTYVRKKLLGVFGNLMRPHELRKDRMFFTCRN